MDHTSECAPGKCEHNQSEQAVPFCSRQGSLHLCWKQIYKLKRSLPGSVLNASHRQQKSPRLWKVLTHPTLG